MSMETQFILVTLGSFAGAAAGTLVAAGIALKKMQDLLNPQNPMEQMMDMFPDEEAQEK